ncbi:hypothetical protein SADUNF_Sadunf16G0203200 [Salix dunnii]|uniref:Protein kinase domain-containing protein n=1 Tax=Salix dunnii TaxID=1413687 RepID=A0A835MHI0_9ROSI|nr:hypothetical protein SADUNF_Sadunf16G0203200 [Salix dunnii]
MMLYNFNCLFPVRSIIPFLSKKIYTGPRWGAISKGTVDTKFKSSSVVRDGTGDREAAIFTYKELSFATSSFRAESFLGSGGFGAVYKRKLESTGQVVAVRKLDPSCIQRISGGGSHALLMHHPNLVSLAGYCGDADHRLLVYECMLFLGRSPFWYILNLSDSFHTRWDARYGAS